MTGGRRGVVRIAIKIDDSRPELSLKKSFRGNILAKRMIRLTVLPGNSALDSHV